MRTRLMFTAVAVLALATSIAAQPPRADSKASTDPATPKVDTLVRHTQLVYVPVEVRGKHHEHIGGLTRDAFTILQDGNPQPISLFEEITAATPVTERLRTFDDPAYVENFAVDPKKSHKTTIILLDTMNTAFIHQDGIMRALLRFLSRAADQQQPMAIMALTTHGLKQIHSFTSDPSVLKAAVERVDKQVGSPEVAKTAFDTGMQSAGDVAQFGGEFAAIADVMRELQMEEFRFAQRSAAYMTINGLEQLAGALAGIPGRKSVVWVGSGIPMRLLAPRELTGRSTEFQEAYQRVWRMMNAANIAIYPLDPTGVMPIRKSALASSERSEIAADEAGLLYPVGEENRATMREFAEATGGRAFLNTNDIEGAFREAADDASSYYMLAYYLHGSDVKPGWHKLKVHVAGVHGDVRAREGFFVASPQADSVESRNKMLKAAITSPADYTGIHFGVRFGETSNVVPKPSLKGAIVKPQNFTVALPLGTFAIDGSADNLVDLDVVVAVMSGDKLIGQMIRQVKMNLKGDELAKVQRGGLRYNSQVPLPAGSYDFRVAIRDNQSGAVGSLHTTVTVK